MALLPDKEKLLRNFLRCANWEEKYLYIIELGQRLPELRAEDRSSQNSIQGCQVLQRADGNAGESDQRTGEIFRGTERDALC